MFKRGLHPKEVLNIGDARFKNHFMEMMNIEINMHHIDGGYYPAKLIEKIKINKYKTQCWLIITYLSGAGLIEDFPSSFDGILDAKYYEMRSTGNCGVDYHYYLNSKYYKIFKDILNEIQ